MLDQNYYIDVHSHILPGVDDGAADLEQSVAMLKEAYAEGIRTIIATPHFIQGREVPKERLQQQLKLAQEEAAKIDPEFTIYLGNEIYFDNGSLDAVKEGRALTLADSRYVLIEFSLDVSYQTIYEGMQSFILNGYLPIIAHFERYECLYKREDRIDELIKLGCYMQVNIRGISGGLFDSHAAMLRKLIVNDRVHLLATDAHNMNQRKPRMESIRKQVSKKITRELFESLVHSNPLKIIQKKYI